MTDEQPEKRDEPAEEPTEEELERRLQALLGESRPAASLLPEQPDDFEEKLQEIEDRAAAIKGTAQMPEPPEWNYKRPESHSDRRIKDDSGSYRGIGVGLTLAYAMVGPLIVGWGIGWFMDQRSGSNQAQTWGAVIGMLLGFLAVVVLLGKTNRDK